MACSICASLAPIHGAEMMDHGILRREESTYPSEFPRDAGKRYWTYWRKDSIVSTLVERHVFQSCTAGALQVACLLKPYFRAEDHPITKLNSSYVFDKVGHQQK